MTYAKTVTWTPKAEACDLLWNYCKHPDHNWIRINPQEVVREALLFSNIINKKQVGMADRSCWEPGQPVKTSLWNENHMDLTQRAKEYGMNKQQVISEAVIDYLMSKQG